MWDTKDPVKTTIQGYRNSAEAYKSMRSKHGSELPALIYFVNNIKGKKVLDIWCAHGRDVWEFCKRWMSVTGIDLTPEFVTMAKEAYPEADIQLMDMRDIKFDDYTFDGLRCWASLLHIPKEEVQQTLAWFHRILKKWGLLFLWLKEWDGEEFDERDRFFAYWQTDEIQEVLVKNNFHIQKSTIVPSDTRKQARIHIFAIAV